MRVTDVHGTGRRARSSTSGPDGRTDQASIVSSTISVSRPLTGDSSGRPHRGGGHDGAGHPRTTGAAPRSRYVRSRPGTGRAPWCGRFTARASCDWEGTGIARDPTGRIFPRSERNGEATGSSSTDLRRCAAASAAPGGAGRFPPLRGSCFCLPIRSSNSKPAGDSESAAVWRAATPEAGIATLPAEDDNRTDAPGTRSRGVRSGPRNPVAIDAARAYRIQRLGCLAPVPFRRRPGPPS